MNESLVRPAVLHVVPALNVGGAQAALARLITAANAQSHSIVVLTPDGYHAKQLREAQVDLTELNCRTIWGAFAGLITLVRLIRKSQPQIVQGWLYYGDLAALLALWLSGRRRRTVLIWSIRSSGLEWPQYKLKLRLGLRVWVSLASRADLVIANSSAGIIDHRAIGARLRRVEIVPNGIDTEHFKPNASARTEIRRELCISDNDIMLIHAARVDPMKDHQTFAQALAILPGYWGMMVGEGTEQMPSQPNLLRLGLRHDMDRLFAAADFVVSSSAFGEGFSNALAEGMSCGLPAIGTDVGETSTIIGDTGLVVHPRQPKALAGAIRKLASEPIAMRSARSVHARDRIVENFSLARMVAHYDALYATILK